MTNNNTSVAIETLLYRNGLSEKDIADAFALFSGYDIDYADFYFQRSVSEGYVLEESIDVYKRQGYCRSKDTYVGRPAITS